MSSCLPHFKVTRDGVEALPPKFLRLPVGHERPGTGRRPVSPIAFNEAGAHCGAGCSQGDFQKPPGGIPTCGASAYRGGGSRYDGRISVAESLSEMVSLLFISWFIAGLALPIVVQACEPAIRSDTTLRVLWIAVGVVWALPFFTVFAQWALEGTQFAFGAPQRRRWNGPSLESTAFLGLFTGCGLVYAWSQQKRSKR